MTEELKNQLNSDESAAPDLSYAPSPRPLSVSSPAIHFLLCTHMCLESVCVFKGALGNDYRFPETVALLAWGTSPLIVFREAKAKEEEEEEESTPTVIYLLLRSP